MSDARFIDAAVEVVLPPCRPSSRQVRRANDLGLNFFHRQVRGQGRGVVRDEDDADERPQYAEAWFCQCRGAASGAAASMPRPQPKAWKTPGKWDLDTIESA